MASFVDIVRPQEKKGAWVFDGLAIVAGSFLIALLAQAAIPLWFTPVPITLQVLGVLLVGALLGSRRGALAVVAYLAQGALGLPVFAGANAGIARLVGPTGGYLLGFVLCAFVVGALLERGWKERFLLTVSAMCIGVSLILACGTLWLAAFVGFENALPLGVYPFLLGDVVKIITAASLVSSGRKLLSWVR